MLLEGSCQCGSNITAACNHDAFEWAFDSSQFPHHPIDVLAREIGLLTRRLEQEGLFNRDHKPSNMVVLPPPFRPPVALIDTVGVQRRRPRAGLERMLANVVFELVGTGRLPARSVLARGLIASMGSRDRRRFRVLWRGIEHRVARHDDLEPRDPVER